jgi:F0F1-type ATP synthase membrane subunit b/b'
MLPQLDSSFYSSQLFWLIICLLVLVILFKRRFIPRIDALLAKREAFTSKKLADITAMEAEVIRLEENVKNLQEARIRDTAEAIKYAIKRSEEMKEEQLEIVKKENEAMLGNEREKLNSEIKNLEKFFKDQIDTTAQIVFEKLF